MSSPAGESLTACPCMLRSSCPTADLFLGLAAGNQDAGLPQRAPQQRCAAGAAALHLLACPPPQPLPCPCLPATLAIPHHPHHACPASFLPSCTTHMQCSRHASCLTQPTAPWSAAPPTVWSAWPTSPRALAAAPLWRLVDWPATEGGRTSWLWSPAAPPASSAAARVGAVGRMGTAKRP